MIPVPRYVAETRDPTELALSQHVMDKDLRVKIERRPGGKWRCAAIAVGLQSFLPLAHRSVDSSGQPVKIKMRIAAQNEILLKG
jgi:hypothetical protein